MDAVNVQVDGKSGGTDGAALPGFGGLWILLGPIRWRLLVACVIGAIGAAASIVPFIAVAQLAGVLLAFQEGAATAVWQWGWVAVAALLVRLMCVFVAGGITHFADTRFQLIVRRRMAARLGRVPLGWFTARTSGTVKKGVSDDVLHMHHLVAHTALEIVDGVVVPVVTLVYLFSINWVMSLFVMLPLVIGIALYAAQIAKVRPRMAEYSTAMGEISGTAVEFVQGISVIKAFGQSGRAYRRFLNATKRFMELMVGVTSGSMRPSALAEVVLAPLTSLVIVTAAGAALAGAGWINPTDVIPFVLLGLGVTAPVMALFFSATATTQAAEASERVLALLATEMLPTSDAPRVPADSTIALEDVRFSYDGEHAALDGIDLLLAPGTTTALVGRSGSGKTTIAKLIPRFWDPDAGRITLGGIDLRDIAPSELYRHVTFVFQDVQLLSASVAENIRLAKPNATLAEVEASARAAQIHRRILELPRGYESVVGEDALLSGGEAQRVSIARALLANAPVLVLDEATAFADPESEALIQDALSELAVGRTLLVIAHRLSTIQGADQIAVVEHGRIVERGTHDDLLARAGTYAGLWANHERSASWHPEVRPTAGSTMEVNR
ncbi:ABC transporter ATP-binding protein [Agreia sp. Leaf244]|uniref:ABC transporter ATP-binding protein n=1 Tax=Agreia sp. Leaf244 TaxID=1736305 RepID=UPI001910A98D|nr:ABC transporter ATP-binding protein [Agreia sp. Leaf244]